jgi:hypothetical protein
MEIINITASVEGRNVRIGFTTQPSVLVFEKAIVDWDAEFRSMERLRSRRDLCILVEGIAMDHRVQEILKERRWQRFVNVDEGFGILLPEDVVANAGTVKKHTAATQYTQLTPDGELKPSGVVKLGAGKKEDKVKTKRHKSATTVRNGEFFENATVFEVIENGAHILLPGTGERRGDVHDVADETGVLMRGYMSEASRARTLNEGDMIPVMVTSTKRGRNRVTLREIEAQELANLRGGVRVTIEPDISGKQREPKREFVKRKRKKKKRKVGSGQTVKYQDAPKSEVGAAPKTEAAPETKPKLRERRRWGQGIIARGMKWFAGRGLKEGKEYGATIIELIDGGRFRVRISSGRGTAIANEVTPNSLRKRLHLGEKVNTKIKTTEPPEPTCKITGIVKSADADHEASTSHAAFVAEALSTPLVAALHNRASEIWREEGRALTSQVVVVQAETLLGRGATIGLGETLKSIGSETIREIVIYTEENNKKKAGFLEELINSANTEIKTTIISRADIAGQRPLIESDNEAEKMEALVKYLKPKGIYERDILCIIRNTVTMSQREELQEFLRKELKVPVIEIESASDDYCYLFVEALKLAVTVKMDARAQKPIIDWLRTLPPIMIMKGSLKKAFEAHKSSLEALKAL